MSDDNEWKQPDAPPPPLFLGEKERDLVKQVNDEVIESFNNTISIYQKNLSQAAADISKWLVTWI